MYTSSNQQADRVREATPASINNQIEVQMWNRVSTYIGKTPRQLSERIDELEKEWDIEQYLGVNMSTLALTGLAAGAFANKRWLALPAIVLGFFMQHSIQGWCPPLPLLRHFQIRTRQEIEQEKYALKIIRGDFSNLDNISYAEVEKLKRAIQS